jgi:hypothetical protein
MRENSFKAYKTGVFKAVHKIDRKANPASLGETLIRHYFNAGYTERSAATAVIELVTVQDAVSTYRGLSSEALITCDGPGN